MQINAEKSEILIEKNEGLNSYRKRINLRHNSVLTKNERLVITTVLLDNTFCGFD